MQILLLFFSIYIYLYKYTAKDAYFLKDINIQKDLLAYGPIEAAFTVYDDFPHYSSGKFL